MIPLKNSTNSWSVAEFERYRPSLTTFIKTNVIPLLDANECRRILIQAPVKSGKREMAEYPAMRDQSHHPHRVHVFITAFHRTADEDQRKELSIHNMKVLSLITKKHIHEAIEWIRRQCENGKDVVVHIDECDFGAGEKQSLCQIYREIRQNAKVTCILYSATPQEVLFSGEVNDDERSILDDIYHTGERIVYQPPETFCGPAKFLDENLIVEAEPFFYKQGNSIVLSDQGREIVRELQQTMQGGSQQRNIIVLRLSYSDIGGNRTESKQNKAIYQFLQYCKSVPELKDFSIIADKGEKGLPNTIVPREIKWSSSEEWKLMTTSCPIIIVIDQKSSRSTEWKCHDSVFAYHDYRNAPVFTTVSQAQERVNHYSGAYHGEFQPIRVYGHKKSFLLSAGRISYSDYMKMDWEMRKVDHRRQEDTTPMYTIRSTLPHHTLHPDFLLPLSKTDAIRALQKLGSFGEIKVSSRVAGTIRHVRIFHTIFYPCTKSTFSSILPMIQRDTGIIQQFRNPFIESEQQQLDHGKYKGYLRKWDVFDYEHDIVTQPGWGIHEDGGCRITICYRGEELGVALRYDTREVKEVNTLETYKSMYKA